MMFHKKRLAKLAEKTKNEPKKGLPNALNPQFYRNMHLEAAKRLTNVSQGGYLELPQEEDLELELYNAKMDNNEGEIEMK
jgi:hypothetical protein